MLRSKSTFLPVNISAYIGHRRLLVENYHHYTDERTCRGEVQSNAAVTIDWNQQSSSPEYAPFAVLVNLTLISSVGNKIFILDMNTLLIPSMKIVIREEILSIDHIAHSMSS